VSKQKNVKSSSNENFSVLLKCTSKVIFPETKQKENTQSFSTERTRKEIYSNL